MFAIELLDACDSDTQKKIFKRGGEVLKSLSDRFDCGRKLTCIKLCEPEQRVLASITVIPPSQPSQDEGSTANEVLE